MQIKGDVLNVSIEERELTSKDGSKRKSKISHVLLSVKNEGGALEIVNLRSYDASWELPAIGKPWTTPRIRRYENYDGNVAEVTV
jgi:hypothetical protein